MLGHLRPPGSAMTVGWNQRGFFAVVDESSEVDGSDGRIRKLEELTSETVSPSFSLEAPEFLQAFNEGI
jgi:hypothetical protein